MSKISRGKTYRNIFFLVASAALIFNLFFDYLSFHDFKESITTMHDIIQSHQMLKHLERLDHAVERLQSEPQNPLLLQSASAEMQTLQHFFSNNPLKSEWLRHMQERLEPLTPENIKQVDDAIDQMIQSQTDFVQNQIIEENKNNERQLHTYSSTFWIDSLLIVFMVALVWIDLNQRNRTEKNLLKSLQLLREANHTLEIEAAKRTIENRTLVHDLKNPLGSIFGFASILNEETEANMTVREFSGTILRISESTLTLVDSLLSQKDKPLDIQPVNVTAILNEVCFQAQGQAELKQQEIISDFPKAALWMQGHQMKLEELLFNLIGNAIKYSPLQSKIWVRCSSAEPRLIIEIEDQGPGFSDDDLNKAFQYGQVLSAKPTGGESSSGLGLFVAKQIVNLFKGTIEIKKRASHEGALIIVAFPQLETSQPRPFETESLNSHLT